MFERLKLRIRDMRTISALSDGAEKIAHENGEALPGAEHFLLAALALPDGTARRAFQRIGADPDTFHSAIGKQYSDALSSIGLNPTSMGADNDDPEPIHTKRLLYDTKPSGQAFMQELATRRHQHAPLLGAHVVEVIASMKQGVAARTLRTMSIDPDALGAAAKQEIDAFRGNTASTKIA